MKRIIALLVILGPVLGYGQTNFAHQQDADLQCCLDSAQNQNTAGILNCIFKASQKWDKEMNLTYRKLMNLLSGEQKTRLRDAQRRWIRFRDQEIEFSDQLYRSLEGTMWLPIAAETRLNLTRQRTFELWKYCEDLTFQEF